MLEGGSERPSSGNGGFVRPRIFVTGQAQVRRSFKAYMHPLVQHVGISAQGTSTEVIRGSKVKHVLYAEGNTLHRMSMNQRYVPPDSAIPPQSMFRWEMECFRPACRCPRLRVLLVDVIPQPPGGECQSR